MPTYLQKRVNRWYAILEIPKDVRHAFPAVRGRTIGGNPKPLSRFVQSLETESRAVAERRVLPVVSGWKRKIAAARDEPVDDDVIYWRRRLHNARDEDHRQSILEQIDDAAWDVGAVNVENIGDNPSNDPEAREFYARATGQLVPLTEHLDEWISTSRATAKTQDMQRSDVNRFGKEFRLVQDVARPEVRRWITKLMNEDGLTPKTVQRVLSALRGYWRYLQSIGVAGEDDEPFTKLDVARQNKRTAPRSARQPFEPSEVVKLLNTAIAQGEEKLADLIRLGMWTGCRIEELCALKVEQVNGDYFSVHDAKTEAGWRDVPIHSELAPTMARLIDGSDDGYVLSGLTVNKYGDRSNGIGKRFGRLKSAEGFGSQHVFHSLRKTVVTILENAGVAENIVADIVGHEKTTMTYGLYSGGVSLKVKREALDKLEYPKSI
jgi:integrase